MGTNALVSVFWRLAEFLPGIARDAAQRRKDRFEAFYPALVAIRNQLLLIEPIDYRALVAVDVNNIEEAKAMTLQLLERAGKCYQQCGRLYALNRQLFDVRTRSDLDGMEKLLLELGFAWVRQSRDPHETTEQYQKRGESLAMLLGLMYAYIECFKRAVDRQIDRVTL